MSGSEVAGVFGEVRVGVSGVRVVVDAE